MDVVTAIFNALKPLFIIWKDENSVKYQKKVLRLKRKYLYEEGTSRPDRNVLDQIEREMVLLSDLINSEVERLNK